MQTAVSLYWMALSPYNYWIDFIWPVITIGIVFPAGFLVSRRDLSDVSRSHDDDSRHTVVVFLLVKRRISNASNKRTNVSVS